MKKPVLGVGLVALLAPAPWLAAGPGGAAETAGASAIAVAQAVRATVVVPRLLVVETLADTGGLVSQAELTPVGGQAFASSVYPGDPATFGQAAGAAGLPRPPDYPLYVAASHPSAPKAEAAPPGQELSADAGEATAAGRAAAGAVTGVGEGPRLGVSESTARAERLADGSVVARAESLVEGAVFPGGLALGRVRSIVTATLAPGGATPDVQASTTVTSATVNGTPVAIGPDGLTTPAPAGLPAGTLRPLEDQLRQAGTSVRRVGAAPVQGGGSTDVIEVRSSAAAPAPGLPEGIVIYRLGGATAMVAAAGPTDAGPPELTPPPGVTLSDGQTAAAGPVPAPATAVAPGSLNPEPTGSQPRTARTFLSAAPTPFLDKLSAAPVEPAAAHLPSAPDATGTAAPALAQPTLAAVGGDGLGNLRARYGQLYLVLILAGLAAFAGSALFRAKGAQARWNS